jgi:hypothetical protein
MNSVRGLISADEALAHAFAPTRFYLHLQYAHHMWLHNEYFSHVNTGSFYFAGMGHIFTLGLFCSLLPHIFCLHVNLALMVGTITTTSY